MMGRSLTDLTYSIPGCHGIAQASYTSIMHHYYSVLVNLLADLTFHQEAAATALAQEVAKQQVISLTSLIS